MSADNTKSMGKRELAKADSARVIQELEMIVTKMCGESSRRGEVTKKSETRYNSCLAEIRKRLGIEE